MRIAVTGASGRIGRLVTNLAVEQGHSVVGIDRSAAEQSEPTGGADGSPDIVVADVSRYDELAAAIAGCDALVHLAAYPSPHGRPPQEVHNNNVTGSYNALAAAVEHGISRVCQASSINAIGGAYSRNPRYDYFPVDELHPTYNEDPYSLSKWICEAQADSFARRYESMTISSLRFHWVVPERPVGRMGDHNPTAARQLWGYTGYDAAARACLLALTADFTGHEAFYIVAPRTTTDVDSVELAREFYPDTPITGELAGNQGFFDCAKAERLLGWKHDV